MPNHYKHHDTLRIFVEIAQQRSFSEAAEYLHMSKGAISYQVKTLEADLGFKLFERKARGVSLTAQGKILLATMCPRFLDIEAQLSALKNTGVEPLTVGMSSYFASRWLSPRLMTFMQKHPDIQLRIQPMIQMFDLAQQGVDLAIRWGNGAWSDVKVTSFMPMPAWPVGNAEALETVRQLGLKKAFSRFVLLRDHDESNAWSDWLDAAKLPQSTRADTLIVPDPNVRVQAVIDGQGIALNDALVTRELEEKQLFRLSDVELSSYGYFLANPYASTHAKSVDAFTQWLMAE